MDETMEDEMTCDVCGEPDSVLEPATDYCHDCGKHICMDCTGSENEEHGLIWCLDCDLKEATEGDDDEEEEEEEDEEDE